MFHIKLQCYVPTDVCKIISHILQAGALFLNTTISGPYENVMVKFYALTTENMNDMLWIGFFLWRNNDLNLQQNVMYNWLKQERVRMN